MSESLSSILCDETWIYDSNIANVILFNKNGTGEVSLIHFLSIPYTTDQSQVIMSCRAERMDCYGVRLEAPNLFVTGPTHRHPKRHTHRHAYYQPVWH